VAPEEMARPSAPKGWLNPKFQIPSNK
jgi:hypothetical protein